MLIIIIMEKHQLQNNNSVYAIQNIHHSKKNF